MLSLLTWRQALYRLQDRARRPRAQTWGIVMKRKTIAAGLAGLLLALTGLSLAWATEPVPGVDVILSQNPGGIVATAATDDKGRVTFYDLPPGTYTVSLAHPSKLPAAVRLSVVAGGKAPVVSDAVPVPPAGARGRQAAPGPVTVGGAPMALVIQPDRTPGAKSYESSRSNVSKKPGLAPPGTPVQTVITVTVSTDQSLVTKGR